MLFSVKVFPCIVNGNVSMRFFSSDLKAQMYIINSFLSQHFCILPGCFVIIALFCSVSLLSLSLTNFIYIHCAYEFTPYSSKDRFICIMGDTCCKYLFHFPSLAVCSCACVWLIYKSVLLSVIFFSGQRSCKFISFGL